jgi:hypothetical protein
MLSNFDLLYKRIRHAEQSRNGFIAYVCRQRAGSKEFEDKKIRESRIDYVVTFFEEEND